MKVLVVYDLASVNRNTEKVAKTIGAVLKEKGFDVDCLYIKDVNAATVKDYDCVLAGSPTHAFRATGPIMNFLGGFSQDEFSGKFCAAFDTQYQGRITRSATKGIEKGLEKLGFELVMPPLVTYVEGKIENVQLRPENLIKRENTQKT